MERIDPGRSFTLTATDGRPLAATLFEPESARGTLIIHGATATPQRFYRPFARHLANAGIRVLTYDYRGVGGSRSQSLREDPATMTEWARCDARAAHLYARENFGSHPLAIVGHSFGGQLIGLIDEAREAVGAIFVGAQLGYYGFWPLRQRARLAVFWHALVPAFSATLGYVPGRAGAGEDLPAGVAGQWRRWCLSREYLLSEYPDAADRFARFDTPAAFYSFTDDEYGPEGAVRALLDRLPPQRIDHRRIDPRDLGKGRIGHFGYFRPRFQDPFWGDAVTFLDDVFAGRTPRRKGQPVPARPKGHSWGLTEEELLSDLRSPS